MEEFYRYWAQWAPWNKSVESMVNNFLEMLVRSYE